MIDAPSAKAVARQAEPPDAETEAAIADDDRVLLSSLDSFPASDPPGWIEGKARPRNDGPPPASKPMTKSAPRT
jgi:hypothetical protein